LLEPFAAPVAELLLAEPALVPESEFVVWPALLPDAPASPELLPPLFEFAAIADVARPSDMTDTARSLNIVFPMVVALKPNPGGRLMFPIDVGEDGLPGRNPNDRSPLCAMFRQH
jgi:hypothetical protein